jgi:hypothetical protein
MRQERFNYSVRVGEVEMTEHFEYFISFSVQQVLIFLQKNYPICQTAHFMTHR